MSRVFVAEDSPKIRISVLKKEGFFAPERVSQREWAFRCGEQSFLVLADEERNEILISWMEDQPKVQLIEIERVELNFGPRPYFICPASGDRCLDLYLWRGALASREFHGLPHGSRRGSPNTRWRMRVERISDYLLGRDGKPRARGLKRSRLVSELRSLGPLHFLDPGLFSVIAADRVYRSRVRRRPFRSTTKDGPMSTKAALARGAALPARGLPNFEDSLGSVARAGPGALSTLRTQELPIALVEDTPALDIRELNRRWGQAKRDVWSTTLAWPVEVMGDAERILLMRDFRSATTPFVLICLLPPSGLPIEQIIELRPAHPNAPPRWFFVCPITGKSCDVLFLRGGCFASAPAQRLVHQSQRAARVPLQAA